MRVVPPIRTAARCAVAPLVAVLVGVAIPAADAAPRDVSRDPRNWPTFTRMVQDRHELAGRVITARVYARPSSYYNCAYEGMRGEVAAFTLMGGPLETLTGYMPRELGDVLERQLEERPWLPITVRLRFHPDRLSDRCPGQVDVLEWSRGWRYPPGSLTPGDPDPRKRPDADALERSLEDTVWPKLTRRPVDVDADAETTPSELRGRSVTVTVGARVSSAYLCAFEDARRTHYALRLHDGRGGFVHAYVPRGPEAEELVDYVALQRDVLVRIRGEVAQPRGARYCRPQIEVRDWSLPQRDGGGDGAAP